MQLRLLCLNGQDMGDLVDEAGNAPSPSGTTAMSYWRARRLAMIVTWVDADVVGLIEAPPTAERTRAFVRAMLDDRYDVWQGERRGPLGLAFLVRRSLGLEVKVRSKDESLEDFPLGAFDADGDGIKELYNWGNRAPLEMTLAGGTLAAPVVFVLVHAKSAGPFVPGDPTANDRLGRANRMKLRAQAAAIRTRLNRLVSAQGEGRVVVMGAMNDGPEFDANSALGGGAFLEPVMGSVWEPGRVFYNPHAGLAAKDRWTVDLRERALYPLQDSRYGSAPETRSWSDHILLSPELAGSVVAGSAGILHSEPLPPDLPEALRGLRASEHHPPYVALALDAARRGTTTAASSVVIGAEAGEAAGASQAPDETEVLLRYVLGHKLEFTRQFMRERKLPYSGTREQLQERLVKMLDAGKLTPEDLVGLLNQIEGWGDQHVYLYNATAKAAAGWNKQADVEKRLAGLGLRDLLNQQRPLILPSERTLSSIAWTPQRLRLVWVERRSWEQRTPEQDRREERSDESILWQAFRIQYVRGLLAFDWDLSSGQALMSIQRLPSGSRYDDIRAALHRLLDPIVPVGELRPVRISRAIPRVGASDEVRRRQIAYKTRRGGQATLQSGDKAVDAFADPQISEAGELLEEGTAGLLGDFYWRPVDGMLSKEVHTKLYADDQRTGIFGEHSESDVRYVLSRIRYHCR